MKKSVTLSKLLFAVALPLLGAFVVIPQSAEALPSEWRPLRSTLETDDVLDTDPAFCSNKIGDILVTVRSTDDFTYYVRRAELSWNPSWKQVEDLTFASRPTCAMRYPYQSATNRFFLAGKSSDNRIYTIEGIRPTSGSGPAPNPNWLGDWQQVNATQYTATDQYTEANGWPALSSNGNRLVLAFLNGNRVSAHSRSLQPGPWTWNQNPANSPVLPSGTNATGVPAITYMGGSTNQFVVMVRGVTSAGIRLFWIYFNGTAFVGNWTQASISNTISSDPALEYDTDWDVLSLYFRSGTDIRYTSVGAPSEIGTYPFYPVPASSSTEILGAPQVLYGGGIEGVRALMVRGFDEHSDPNQLSHSILMTVAQSPPWDSCEGLCGDQSAGGSCWCDSLCTGYGDCCVDVCLACGEC